MEAHQWHALLPQSPYKKRTLKPYHIKYYWLILVIFMMIAAIQVFVNYATIQTSIVNVTREKAEIERHKAYLSLQAYVYTLPESKIFIAHDNSILQQWERIMTKVSLPDVITSSWDTQTWSMLTGDLIQSWTVNHLVPPWKSWVLYFWEKMDK